MSELPDETFRVITDSFGRLKPHFGTPAGDQRTATAQLGMHLAIVE